MISPLLQRLAAAVHAGTSHMIYSFLPRDMHATTVMSPKIDYLALRLRGSSFSGVTQWSTEPKNSCVCVCRHIPYGSEVV